MLLGPACRDPTEIYAFSSVAVTPQGEGKCPLRRSATAVAF